MKKISYTHLRKNLASLLDEVVENHTPVLIKRHGKETAVLISLDDYNSYEETNYLLKCPANSKHLLESVAQIKNSKH